MNIDVPDLYIKRAKVIMKILGVWIPSTNETVLKRFYRIFMFFLQFLFLLFQIIYMIQVWGSFEAVCDTSYFLFTQACLCLKISVFQINSRPLKKLLEQMSSEVFRPQSTEHVRILQLQANKVKRFLLAFMVSSQATCVMFALKPLFDSAGRREFPFQMWMPISPDCSPQYELGYAFQLITLCLSAYMYFGVDSVALLLVIFTCAQIEIIKDKIISINTISKTKSPGAEREKITSKCRKKLVECVRHHQAAVTFSQLVEDTYHTYIFFQLCGGVGMICMSALRAIDVEWLSVQFISLIGFLFAMITQLYAVCWCGHELTASSESLHGTLYECNWYEQDVKFKRDLCFVMMRMSRSMRFRAGHYLVLSRQTFVAILRLSYSYFAVLNSVNA